MKGQEEKTEEHVRENEEIPENRRIKKQPWWLDKFETNFVSMNHEINSHQ